MKTSTAYNHYTRLKSRLESIYSGAECYHSTHEHILNEIDRLVWQDKSIKKCPGWVRQGLSDYSSFRLNQIHQNYLVWLHQKEDGTVCSWDLLSDSERQSYNSPDKKGAHYWLRKTTPCVGTIANPGNYKAGDVITRTFEVTSCKF